MLNGGRCLVRRLHAAYGRWRRHGKPLPLHVRDRQRVTASPEEMGAFAEACYFGWQNVEPVSKATHSVPIRFWASADRARSFSGGPVLLVRLAPVDYHHMRILMTERRGHHCLRRVHQLVRGGDPVIDARSP
jgi:hypothetical protein